MKEQMFKWIVAKSGYHWLKADKETVVTQDEMSHYDRHPFKGGDLPNWYLEFVMRPTDTYEPFKNPAIFRTFAEVPLTPSGMLAFANDYGNLGDQVEKCDDSFEPPSFELPYVDTQAEVDEWEAEILWINRRYDSISSWFLGIKEMRKCVKICDQFLLGKADEEAVDQLFSTINKKLTRERCRVAFARDVRNPSAYSLQTIPTNLLAALWIQLGRAVTENKRFHSCSTCKRWFEVSPPLNRTSRDYCSNACRSRAYRSRIEEARRMKQIGKSVREIAELLESTEKTVEGWLE